LIDAISATIEALARVKGLIFTCNIAPEVPATLTGDPYWLRQILANLVSNAIKFTEQGEVRVQLYCPDTSHWAIQVIDTGPGIPLEAQTHIFEPFEQIDGSMTRKYDGAGLGLSIVKHLTTLMDGQVNLVSEVGQGSTFTVILSRPIATEEVL
jgi:signal transduction histidine kinase